MVHSFTFHVPGFGAVWIELLHVTVMTALLHDIDNIDNVMVILACNFFISCVPLTQSICCMVLLLMIVLHCMSLNRI